MRNKYLIAAKVDLMNKVKCKDSILEEVISNFACDECDFVAGTSKELLEHIRTPHMTKRVRFYNCKECKISLRKEFDMKIHNSLKHPDKLMWK